MFVDEVHRFNKSQQDAFLPHVESGLLTFIGATTENPSFEVNGALLSRAQVYVLESLKPEDLDLLIERGFEAEKIESTGRARAHRGVRRRRRAARAEPRRAGGAGRARGGRRGADVDFVQRVAQRAGGASTRAATISTTRSRRCTRACAAAIPTPRSTGWCACSTAASIRATSRGA
jgi:putative ATPase